MKKLLRLMTLALVFVAMATFTACGGISASSSRGITKAYFNEEGHLILVQTDGSKIEAANDTNIVGARYNEEGHLILIQADGSEIDVGKVEPVRTYTVIYQDWDGTILKMQSNVKYGQKVEAPTVPLRMFYEFLGWDDSSDNVTSDMIIHAQYRCTKEYNDVYDIDSVLDDAEQKLTLKFSFSQSTINPVPIMAFQVRIVYDEHYTCLEARGGANVSYFIHEDSHYISAAYFNLSGEMVGSSFEYLSADFDVSNCVAGDQVTLEIKYIIDVDGQEMAERVTANATYIFNEKEAME